MIRKSLFSLLTAFSLVTVSFAGDPKGPVVMPPAPVANDDFHCDFRVDGWILGIDISYTNSIIGASQETFLSFGDIIGNVDWLVPLGADFRYQRFGFLPDIVALKMSGGAATPGPGFDRAGLSIKLASLNLPFYYRVVDQPDLKLDLLGGARLLWVDMNVGFDGGLLGNRIGHRDLAIEEYIWDGIVGARLQKNINEKLFCTVYGDVGTGDSELTWQFQADVGYQFTESFSASVGYRYLDYKEESTSSVVDLNASGPIVTLNWEF